MTESFVPKPARRTRLADTVYGRILDDILGGTFAEGDKLPSEQELCAAFGVSRPVAREAMTRLQADGLVRTHQGVGSFVNRRPSARLGEFASSAEISDYLRSLEARILLETEAARLAALRRSPAQLEAIRRSHATLKDCAARGAHGWAEDMAFHDAILEAAGNEYFPLLMQTIRNSVVPAMAVGLDLGRERAPDQRRRVIEEHGSILGAIMAQDADGAAAYMRYHLLQARAGLTDMNHLA
ncbi:FadR/GntR family transcriptional regulator [Mangrovicoccus algicola]|uniref:FadR family transcriptional regulator n=1 Tax=Mangrovicoccus algicola TaxID=2771008 RepID=A0A8J6YTP9_9RHOB|nr:FadR/GntR family transcriptional regulator [Mangrovicoccus algicola]MBE3637637.1 FadR family transcriptional regulator [Mangrovicoccus algicola]